MVGRLICSLHTQALLFALQCYTRVVLYCSYSQCSSMSQPIYNNIPYGPISSLKSSYRKLVTSDTWMLLLLTSPSGNDSCTSVLTIFNTLSPLPRTNVQMRVKSVKPRSGFIMGSLSGTHFQRRDCHLLYSARVYRNGLLVRSSSWCSALKNLAQFLFWLSQVE